MITTYKNIFRTLVLGFILTVAILTALVRHQLSQSFSKAFEKMNAQPAAVEKPEVVQPLPETPKELAPEIISAHLSKAYDRCVENYKDELLSAYRAFKTQIGTIHEDFAISSAQVFEDTIHEKITIRTMMRLVRLKATDMIRRDGKDRDTEWINNNIVSTIEPSGQNYAEKYQEASAMFEQRVKIATGEIQARFQIELNVECAALNNDPSFAQAAAKALSHTSQIPVSFAMLSAGVAFDGAAIQSGMITRIGASLTSAYGAFAARFLTKPAKKAAASGIAVAVDGPLPVGDILGAGFAIWTAYDVATLSSGFRKKMIESYQEGLDEQLAELETTVFPSIQSNIEEIVRYLRDKKQSILNAK